MNRQFVTNGKENQSIDDITDICVEKDRAVEIQKQLGFKRNITDGWSMSSMSRNEHITNPSDFIIDLHSTTSNVGLVAMISAGSNDILATRIAYHLQQLHPELKITYSSGTKYDSHSLDSISTSGLAFEVGPVVHGNVDMRKLYKTRELIKDTLN